MPWRNPLRICIVQGASCQGRVVGRHPAPQTYISHDLRTGRYQEGYTMGVAQATGMKMITSADRSPTCPGLLGMKMVAFLEPTS